ncbi:signal recognition particle-docking protein FtsY [Alkaliphilus serpentinus]|uniref:Signal recognition particle receptor FtsY n=1 Tax=Alkaliphilus serpentinus TaxID=1482731 RepID=A0A833MAP2_9FIRM|nr:signal recognition particle-docking protein FtsY [Alkaliphilus serpentinus]KAB3531413.1 signal recognition particle-docking protein FtsY [Alkaliphilus serpentinus]
MFKKLFNKLTNKETIEKEKDQDLEYLSHELEELEGSSMPEEILEAEEEEIRQEVQEGYEEIEEYEEELDEDYEEIAKEFEVQEEEEEPVILEEEPQQQPPTKVSLFQRLKEGLAKTKQGITGKVDELIKSYQKIDDDLFDELEEILITADIGVQTTMDIIDAIKDKVKSEKIKDPLAIKELLKEQLFEILNELSDDEKLKIEPSPAIILVVGVNGVGKTTSIGKIAHRLKGEGKKVLLAAGDTFRAAAIDQLQVWGKRAGVEVIHHQEGSDPAAVIYDAIQAARARNAEVLICDTAGRLHNKKNLMMELEKIFRVVEREYSNATREVLLVLDATTGQNAIQQAKIFNEAADITGLILTKLDGTAKGGVVIGISRELKVPVKFIGVGEQKEDLQEFDSKAFVNALFGQE